MRPHQRSKRLRSGLSLLEVILALVILGMSMGVVGQLVNLGSRNAVISRDLLSAQFMAESKMEEIRAGIFPPEPMGPIPFEQHENVDPGESWVYSVMVEPLQDQGLLAVGVTVERQGAAIPVQFSLISWMIDLELEEEMEAAEAAADEAAAEANSGGETQGGGTGGGGAPGGGNG